MRLGIISDTHGLLRPEVFEIFSEVDRIIHAGDIGPPELLTELEAIAPVTAVYGNTDDVELRARLPEVLLEKGEMRLIRRGETLDDLARLAVDEPIASSREAAASK